MIDQERKQEGSEDSSVLWQQFVPKLKTTLSNLSA